MRLEIFRVIFLLLVFGKAQAEEQKQLQNHGHDHKLFIYTEQLPPFNYQSDGQLQGIAVDIVKECLRRQGMSDLPIHLLPWDRAYDIALKQKNSLLFSTGRLPHREHLFKWVGPIADYHMVLLARKDSTLIIKNWNDLRSVNHIAVAPNTAAAYYLEDLNFNNLDYHSKHQLNTIKLLSGRVDLLVDSFETSQFFTRNNNAPDDALKALAHIYTAQMYLAFSITTPDTVISQWQDTLQAIRDDGSYDTITARYPRLTQQQLSIMPSLKTLGLKNFNHLITEYPDKETSIHTPQ